MNDFEKLLQKLKPYILGWTGSGRIVPISPPVAFYAGGGVGVGTVDYYIAGSYGVAENAPAVMIRSQAKWASANDGYNLVIGEGGTANPYLSVRDPVANFYAETCGMVKLAADGTMRISVVGGSATSTYVYITGYVTP